VSANVPCLRPNATAAVLILMGVQRDFYEVGAPARVEGTLEAVPAMAKLAAAFRERARPIVHVVRLYRTDGSNVDAVRRHAVELGARVATPGTSGSQIAPELLPEPVDLDHQTLLDGAFQELGLSEHALYQPRWGAFYRTDLTFHLQNAEADTLVFAGCNFPNCLRTSVYEASERDFRVVLAADATSGLYERGVEECRRIGVSVWDVADIRKWLEDR